MGVRNCEDLGPSLQKIVTKLLANQNLCKLLYYSDSDPLSHADFVDTKVLYENYIYVTPKYNPVSDDRSVVVLIVSGGGRDSRNNEFSNITIQCYIYVPITNWIIKDVNLRPFSIIGEIQKSLSGKSINGLGKVEIGDFSANMITEQNTCYTLDLKITTFA